MIRQYTIERWENALVLRGPIPVDEMDKIADLASELGFDRIDPGLASAVEASFVITNKAGSEKMREQVEKRNAFYDRENRWLLGLDTGNSSKTIFEVMTGRLLAGRGEYPYDPDDFGRCHRLLELFPEWRPRLGEVAAKYPCGWTGLVEVWPRLTELFVAANYKQLYAEMQVAYNKKES